MLSPRRLAILLSAALALTPTLLAQESAGEPTTEDATELLSDGPEAGTEPEDEEDEDIEQITIVADYEALDPRTVSAQVSVVGSDEIEASAPRTAADIVAPILGVQINRYGGITEPSTVSIRGSSPEQVLVLVNGKRMNSAQGGGVDLNSIDPDSIERIEVIRGGSSAIYGESAFGGVINIITKDGYGKDLGGSLSYGYASLNTHTLAAQYMGSFGPEKTMDFFVSASGLYTEGNYAYSDSHSDTGYTTRTNTEGLKGDTTAKLGWDIDSDRGMRLSLATQTHNDSKGVPGLAEFPTPDAEIQDQLYRGTLSFNYAENPITALGVDLYLGRQIRDYTNPDDIEGEVSDRHDNTYGGLDLDLKRNDRFGFLLMKSAAALQLRADRLVSTGLLESSGTESAAGSVTRATGSAALRADIHLFPDEKEQMGRLSLFPALRFDVCRLKYPDGDVDSVNQALSYNLGVMLPLLKDRSLTVKANAGFAYRLPSFDDLFWPATAFAVGNPELLPEEAYIWDAGVLFQPFRFLSLELVYFNHDIANLIQWTPGPSGQWRPTNLASAHIRGVETELKLLFSLEALDSYCEIRGNYSYTRAEDTSGEGATTGTQLPRRPYEKANIGATLTHADGHSLHVDGRYVGFRYTTAQNTKYLPSYFVLDASVNLAVREGWKLTVIGRNLLDAEYVDIREYPVPGRELGIGVEISL